MWKKLLNILRSSSYKGKEESKKMYKSIKELPVKVWFEFNEGVFQNIIIKGKFENTEIMSKYLELVQEYYNSFGTSNEYQAFVKKKLEYAKKLCTYLKNQDGTSKMWMEICKVELEDLTPKENKSNSLDDYIVSIENYYKFQINSESLSTYKFYTYLKNMQKNG